MPSGDDLQIPTIPTNDDINSLEKAMDDAGLGDVSFPVDDTKTPPDGATTPPAVPAPAEEGKVSDKEDDEGGIDDIGNPLAVEKPPETVPPIADRPAAKKDELTPDDIKTLNIDEIKPPDDISPRNVVNFDKLRSVAKHWQTEAQRVPELEAQLAKVKTGEQLPEELKTELEDLRKWRSVFDVENDPEFKKQFTETTSRIDEEVLTIMKRHNLPESVEKELREAGLGNVPQDWWEENILPKLPFIDRERIQKRLAERADIVDSREQRVAKAIADRPGFLAEQQQRQGAEFATYSNEIQATVNELTKDIPWANPIAVPADATPEQTAQIEAHNKGIEQLEVRFQEALWPRDARHRAEIACAAVASVKLAGDVNTLAAKLEAKEKELAGLTAQIASIKSAGRMPGSRTPVPSGKESVLNLSGMPDEDAIEAGLQAAEGA